jgi:hypothetical protein
MVLVEDQPPGSIMQRSKRLTALPVSGLKPATRVRDTQLKKWGLHQAQEEDHRAGK